MTSKDIICVTSRSFSKNEKLVSILQEIYPEVRLNKSGNNLSEDQLVEFLQGANKAIIGLEVIDKKILEKLPELKLISKYGVGLNNINLEDCKKFNISVSFTPGSNSQTVAEFTLMQILLSLRKIHNNKTEILDKVWSQEQGLDLYKKNIAILGFGNIGKKLLKLLVPFNASIKIFDKEEFDKKQLKTFYSNLTQASLEETISESDVISIHIPLSDDTSHMISSKEFSYMKSNVCIVNSSRGGIVDESALHTFLNKNKKAFACFDVFEEEPCFNSPLLELNNFFATSHRASLTEEGIMAMGLAAIKGLN